jgi:hypothetical protein
MSTWEYRVLHFREDDFEGPRALSETLRKRSNALGADGWEMVAMIPDSVFGEFIVTFKRPTPGAVPARALAAEPRRAVPLLARPEG